MPAANQCPFALLTTRSTGFVHETGGNGVRVSSIRKSPSRATPAALVKEGVPQLEGVVLQKSLARTDCPPFVPITFLKVALPPAKSSPRPSTVMCPSASTLACRRLILHGRPPGSTPQTTLETGRPDAMPETGSTPMPPLNLTKELSAMTAKGTRTTRARASNAVFMAKPPFGLCSPLRVSIHRRLPVKSQNSGGRPDPLIGPVSSCLGA